MTLCNQGCGTHVFFKNGRPYNRLDKKKHDCPMLHMAKLWGGRYNTIPMGRIENRIFESYTSSSKANQSRNVDEILKALQTTVDNLQYVTYVMAEQAEQNAKWDNELESYKEKLVDDQRRREKEKQDKLKKRGYEWKRGDELL